MLGVERLEVSFHTKMIANLLNPAGTHGQGAVFLNDFLAVLRDNSVVNLPPTDDDGSGYFIEPGTDYIDLNIYKSRVCYLGLENKIDAIEQPRQVARYWESITAKPNYPTKALIFLTLTGRESDTAEGATYFPMSYKEHILDQWLNKCVSHRLPSSVKGTLAQDRDTIARMTDMSSRLEHDPLVKMMADARKLQLAYEIMSKIEDTKTLLQARFWNAMRARFAQDFQSDSLRVDLTKGWEAEPNKYDIGCEYLYLVRKMMVS